MTCFGPLEILPARMPSPISCNGFLRACSFFIKQSIVDLMAVAVVSDPARLQAYQTSVSGSVRALTSR